MVLAGPQVTAGSGYSLSQLFWESKFSYWIFSMNCWDVLLGVISANIHSCGTRDSALQLINMGLM